MGVETVATLKSPGAVRAGIVKPAGTRAIAGSLLVNVMTAGETFVRFMLTRSCIVFGFKAACAPFMFPVRLTIARGTAGATVRFCVSVTPLKAAVAVTAVGASTLAGAIGKVNSLAPCGAVIVAGSGSAAELCW